MLFRSEAARERNRLHGHVSLAPPVAWQLLGGFLVIIVLLAVAFLSLATYGRHVTATGEAAGDRGVVTVSSPRPGTLTHILVREGEVVQAGQPLARIGFDTIAGNGSLERRRAAALGDEASALSAKANAEHTATEAKIATLGLAMQGQKAELDELAVQLTEQRRLVTLAQDELERARATAGRGFISGHEISLREQTLAERRQALAQFQRERASLTAELAKGSAEIRREQAAQAVTVAEVARARGQLAGASAGEAMQREIAIVAPVAGQVTGILHTPGESIGSDRPLLSLVPAGTRLVARLTIPAAGMGFIRPGQTVALSVDAFPRETFGTLPARITYVTGAPVPGRENGGPAFLAEAEFSRPDMAAYGARYPLLPGMALTAVVTTRRLSLMRWLLDPLYAVIER